MEQATAPGTIRGAEDAIPRAKQEKVKVELCEE